MSGLVLWPSGAAGRKAKSNVWYGEAARALLCLVTGARQKRGYLSLRNLYAGLAEGKRAEVCEALRNAEQQVGPRGVQFPTRASFTRLFP
jgi:hypothetical protein